MTPDDRWQALKDWLAGQIRANLAAAQAAELDDQAPADEHYHLVVANALTMVQMSKLEEGTT